MTNLNSVNGGAGHHRAFLDLGIEEFQVVFQATKELANISDANLDQAGFTRVEADLIYKETARLMRENAAGAQLFRIHYDETDPLCSVTVIGDDDKDLGRILRFDLLLKWPSMIELVLSSLGSLEVYLRTGYDEREIRAAARGLELLSR